MPCAESWVRRRNCSPPGTNTSAWRGRSAPPDSTRMRSGRRFSSATSMARRSLRIVVGLVVPPRTVGSFAMTRHCVCAISASATTTPPPTGSPVCSPASGQSSSTGVPGSTSASRRSRTIILPRARCRSTYCAPPPARTLVVQRAHLVGERAHGVGVGRELGVGRRQQRAQGRAHRVPVLPLPVVSHEGRRFSRKASMPSAASSPANSSAETPRRAPGPRAKPSAGQVAQQLLGGADRAGRALADGRRLVGHPVVERRLPSAVTALRRPAAAASARRSAHR